MHTLGYNVLNWELHHFSLPLLSALYCGLFSDSLKCFVPAHQTDYKLPCVGVSVGVSGCGCECGWVWVHGWVGVGMGVGVWVGVGAWVGMSVGVGVFLLFSLCVRMYFQCVRTYVHFQCVMIES